MKNFALLVGIIFLGATGCSTEVLHGLEENEANEIIAVMQQNGLAADKLRVTEGNKASYTIKVGRGQAVLAWKLLRQENLPKPKQRGINETFGQPSLVPTTTQERALMHQALAGELAQTLQNVDGVMEARVHLVLPARDQLAPPDAPQAEPRASVLLRVGEKSPLADEEIRRIIVGAVDGLKPEAVNVTVISGQGRRSTGELENTITRLGPFAVAATSRTPLILSIIGGAVVIIFLCSVLVVLLRQNLRLQHSIAQQTEAAGNASLDTFSSNSSLNMLSRSMQQPNKTAAGKRSFTRGGRDN